MIERQKDKIDEQYQEHLTEADAADKLTSKLTKQFDKIIDAEADKLKGKGIKAERVKEWVRWKMCRGWGK